MKEVILPVLLEVARLLGAPVYLSGVFCFGERLYLDGCGVLVLFLLAAMLLTSLPFLLLMQAVGEGNVMFAYAALGLYTAYWAFGRFMESRSKESKN